MLEVLFNAAANWVQNNMNQVGCMAKKAYDSAASSFRSNSGRTKIVQCPHCGRRYELDEKVYNESFKGTSTTCECSRTFYCQ